MAARAEHDALRRVREIGDAVEVRVNQFANVDQVGRLGGGAGAGGHASSLPLG